MNSNSSKSLATTFFTLAETRKQDTVYFWPTLTASGKRIWRKVTYAQAATEVSRIAGYLRTIGVSKGSRVAILSNSRPEWMLSDLAILAAGAVSVSIYPSLPYPEVGYMLWDSGAKVVFAENREQVEKLEILCGQEIEIPATEERPASRAKIELDKIISFEDLPNSGAMPLRRLPDAAYDPQVCLSIQPEDLACLVYTSGTTGPPKAVMQSHSNHLANLRQVYNSGLLDRDACILIVLPLAHSFAKLMGYLGFLSSCTIVFPAITNTESSKLDPKEIMRDMAESPATIVPVVPRILEKIQHGLLEKSRHGGIAGFIVRNALLKSGIIANFCKAILRRKLFGRHCKYAVSGGAKLPVAVSKFFNLLNLTICEGYGLTETCVATNANRPNAVKIGSVGPVLSPDIELRISEDGEILFRGPNITSGYMNRSAATAVAWDKQGWFHTGDLGQVDQDGYLSITGRKKEILVTSYGKKIAPEPLEQDLKRIPHVINAVVFGDGKSYCVALLVLDLSGWNKFHKSGEPIDSQKIQRFIQEHIDKFNAELASFETIKKFALISEDFTTDNGLLTPTFKPKRKAILDRYLTLIESMYLD